MLYINNIEVIKAFMSTTDREVYFSDEELQAILDYYQTRNEEFDKYTLQAWGSYEDPIDCLEINDEELLSDDFYEMDCVMQMDRAWKILRKKYPVIVMPEDDETPYHILVRIGK